MRIKTEGQRRAVMAAASQVFREVGYDRASMSAISASLGGSKTTSYSYFDSKEELFAAVMIEAIEAYTARFETIFSANSSGLRATLLRFGSAYLTLLLSPEVIAIVRSGLEGREQGLGRLLFERGPGRNWGHVADFLAGQITAGKLRKAEPLEAALHLKGLLQAGLFEPYMFGAPAQVSRSKAVRVAVDAFLRAYRPD